MIMLSKLPLVPFEMVVALVCQPDAASESPAGHSHSLNECDS
jgi:hypothetical protein